MTKREAAIVSAYTGYLIGEFSDFQAYAEEVMGDRYLLMILRGLNMNSSRRARRIYEY